MTKPSVLLRRAIAKDYKRIQHKLYARRGEQQVLDKRHEDKIAGYCALGAIGHEAGIPVRALRKEATLTALCHPLVDEIDCLPHSISAASRDAAAVILASGSFTFLLYSSSTVEELIFKLNDRYCPWERIADVLESFGC